MAIAGFLAGVWPLVMYNMRTGGATLGVIRQSTAHTYLGVSNLDVLSNLRVRISQVIDVIGSGDHLWYLGGTFKSLIAIGSVIIGLLILLASVIYEPESWKQTLFVPFLMVIVILQSCFTISALWTTHFAIIVTLPAIIFGVAVGKIYFWNKAGWRRWLVALSATMVIVAQANTSASYLDAVVRSGGLSFHSSAIYNLYRSVSTHSEPIVALDWGIATQLEYLSGGRIEVTEMYGYEREASDIFEAGLKPRFERNELFITHAEGQEGFPRRRAFLDAVAGAGWWAERVDTIQAIDGSPVFEVWRVRRPGE